MDNFGKKNDSAKPSISWLSRFEKFVGKRTDDHGAINILNNDTGQDKQLAKLPGLKKKDMEIKQEDVLGYNQIPYVCPDKIHFSKKIELFCKNYNINKLSWWLPEKMMILGGTYKGEIVRINHVSENLFHEELVGKTSGQVVALERWKDGLVSASANLMKKKIEIDYWQQKNQAWEKTLIGEVNDRKINELKVISNNEVLLSVVNPLQLTKSGEVLSLSCENGKWLKKEIFKSGYCSSIKFGQPQFKKVIIGCVGGKIRLWEEGKEMQYINSFDYENELTALDFLSEAGDSFVAGDLEGNLMEWRKDEKIASGPWKVKYIGSHSDGAITKIIGLSGDRVLSGGRDGVIKIWKKNFYGWRGDIVGEHDGPINDLKMMKDGRVVSVADDKMLIVWDGRKAM